MEHNINNSSQKPITSAVNVDLLPQPLKAKMLINDHYSFHHRRKAGILQFSPDDIHLYFIDKDKHQLADISLASVQGIIHNDPGDIELITADGVFEFDLDSSGRSVMNEYRIMNLFVEKVATVNNPTIVLRPFEIARFWPPFSVLAAIVTFIISSNLTGLSWLLCIGIILIFPFAAHIRLLYLKRANKDWRDWPHVDSSNYYIDPQTQQRVHAKPNSKTSAIVLPGAMSILFLAVGAWDIDTHAQAIFAVYLFGMGTLMGLATIKRTMHLHLKAPKPLKFVFGVIILVLIILKIIINFKTHLPGSIL
jgi:hypothetical protein